MQGGLPHPQPPILMKYVKRLIQLKKLVRNNQRPLDQTPCRKNCICPIYDWPLESLWIVTHDDLKEWK